MSIDPVELQAIRDAARGDLYFFSRYMFKRRRNFQWKRNWHHQVVCDALMRVYRGETRNLIINIPPRYSKTEIAVMNFCAWAMGMAPDSEFIHTSYSAKLAAKNSAGVKELLTHEAFGEIFPDVHLAADATAKDDWKTTAGGSFYATGSGGTITGFGAGKARDGFAGAIVIDDPHKADEASSDTIREGVIEWFQNTLESRVNNPNTPKILIMQRLHERDLAGWLLDGGNGEEWEHLCIPAINDGSWPEMAGGKVGDALWPWKHSIDALRVMEKKKPYVFSGQYQQQPSPAEGGIFKPDRITIVDALPYDLTEARGWDFAGTEEGESTSGDPDYTVGAKLATDALGRVFITDIVRGQMSPFDVEMSLKNTAARDGHGVRISIPQDPGQAGKMQSRYFVQKLAGYIISASVETGPKTTRAAPLASQMEAGNVYMLRAPWNDALIAEMRMFPNGAHDDQVDACSRAFSSLFTQQSPAWGSI
ncbi:phage terminase large subunit [Paraburkholderia kururiensis]|uniref:phage terminase large subunit n=1 Tax=Paraburkholderia kururiensis TaxID=984307 RepID=UPI0005AB8B6A|nr:phage terminase large subunit [Paraburkholderia kururiensis]